MLDSKRSFRFAALLVLGTGFSLHADELKLKGGTRLTGTVRSISETGTIALETSLSPEPVLLRGAAVSKIEFSAPSTVPESPGALVELANGDLLPLTVDGLDDANLSASTPDAGKLTIPRKALNSLQMGVRSKQLVYSGPRNMEEWTRDPSGMGQWSFTNKALVANGPAYASRSFDLPRQFVLKFKLKWKSSPSFQIYFADPLKKADQVDRYFLQFNSAGLEIKREATIGKRFQTVILLSRTPDQFETNQVDVEIRVDRKSSRIHLLLNGEPEAAGLDPSTVECTGNGIQLVNSSPPGGNQEIRDIQILELDNTRARQRAEDRGSQETDSLISREDDRWGGQLTSIRKNGADLAFVFKSDFQEEPLELATDDISTIFFAKDKDAPVSPASGNYLLRLRGEGVLHLDSCVVSGNSLLVRHPLLGELKIARSGIATLERTEADPKPETEGNQ